MPTSKIHIAVLFLALIISCSTNSEKPSKIAEPDRQCDCFQLRHRLERGFYLNYLEGEDSLYTGMCKITRENGNEITYKYLKGHILEIIEYYPGKILYEEMLYDTTGMIIKRVNYYPNGHKSYELVKSDHAYETFYENGRIERRGAYGYIKENIGNYFNLYEEVKMYDSIWKADGSFDSVFHYTRGSMTY